MIPFIVGGVCCVALNLTIGLLIGTIADKWNCN